MKHITDIGGNKYNRVEIGNQAHNIGLAPIRTQGIVVAFRLFPGVTVVLIEYLFLLVVMVSGGR